MFHYQVRWSSHKAVTCLPTWMVSPFQLPKRFSKSGLAPEKYGKNAYHFALQVNKWFIFEPFKRFPNIGGKFLRRCTRYPWENVPYKGKDVDDSTLRQNRDAAVSSASVTKLSFLRPGGYS